MVASRSDGFIGRSALLEQLHAWAAGSDGVLGVVWGVPGSGKSAVLAQFCSQLLQQHRPDTMVIVHVVGATPASQSLRACLRRICMEVLVGLKREESVPENIEDLKAFFVKLLEDRLGGKGLILVIDAINQVNNPYIKIYNVVYVAFFQQMLGNNKNQACWIFSPSKLTAQMDPADDALDLGWLPRAKAKSGLKIILSTLPSTVLDKARAHPIVELPVPLLDQGDRAAIVRTILNRYHKKLTENENDNFLGNQVCIFFFLWGCLLNATYA